MNTNTQSNTTLINFFNEIECGDFCTFAEVDKNLLQDVYDAIQTFKKADKTVRFNHEAVAKLFQFQDYDLLGTDTEDDTHTKLTQLAENIHTEFKADETYGNILEIEGFISEGDVWAAIQADDAEDADEYLIRILSGFTDWDEEDMVEYVLKQSIHRELAKEFCGKDWVSESQVERFENNVGEALQMAYYKDCEKRGLNGDTYVIRPFFTTDDYEFYNVLMNENPAELFIVGAA